ncbi:MAG: hypothetical protein AAFQ87_17285 [Bacteroidota bacterium]
MKYKFREYRHHSLVACEIDKQLRLRDARPIFLNTLAVREHYPKLNAITDIALRKMLTYECGCISETQANTMEFATATPNFLKGESECLRPESYGRAGIFGVGVPHRNSPVEEYEYLIDVKGCGVRSNKVAQPEFNHNNGILTLHEAVIEYFWYSVLQGMRNYHDVPILPHFGLIDLGFSVQIPPLPPVPAVTLLRAPHYRGFDSTTIPGSSGSLAYRMISLEQKLNSAGISTSVEGYNVREDGGAIRLSFFEWEQTFSDEDLRKFLKFANIECPYHSFTPNVQLCDLEPWSDTSKVLVDFGHYNIFYPEAGNHGTQRVSDQPFNWGPTFRYFSPHSSARKHLARLIWLRHTQEIRRSDVKRWLATNGKPERQRTGIENFALELSFDYIHHRIDGSDL